MSGDRHLQPMLNTRKDSAFLLSLSLRTIDNLILRKELKATRVGGRVMISTDELQRFIKRDHPTGAELN